MDRVTFSLGEFAALFGKSQTWGYRQIYAGKVQAITEYGRILIPAAEVERILKTAGRYEGSKKMPVRTKADLQAMKPALQSAWEVFIAMKRKPGKKVANCKSGAPSPRLVAKKPTVLRRAIERVFGARKRSESGGGGEDQRASS